MRPGGLFTGPLVTGSSLGLKGIGCCHRNLKASAADMSRCTIALALHRALQLPRVLRRFLGSRQQNCCVHQKGTPVTDRWRIVASYAHLNLSPHPTERLFSVAGHCQTEHDVERTCCRARQAARGVTEWRDTIAAVTPLVQKFETSTLHATAFSPWQ